VYFLGCWVSCQRDAPDTVGDNEENLDYFAQYGKEATILAINELFSSHPDIANVTIPYQVSFFATYG
jgi:hypothetical protein